MLHACKIIFCKESLDCVRPVKKHAAAWDMQDVLWMFQGSKDVEADVQVMMELRSSLALDCGHLEKIVVAQRCSTIFAIACEQLKTSMVQLKAGPSLVLFATCSS